MKKILFSLVLAILVAPMFMLTVAPVSAADDTVLWGNQKDVVSETINLGNQDPRVMAANVINIMLGFLGIIAVMIILLGGFKWMTAGGNEDKVGEAKALMAAGVIGMIIILASWSLGSFMVDSIYQATQG